jgi:predicted NACHT family NTPase
MVKRSLRASTAGIERAKKAFQRKGWTQEYLAGEVGLETRHSIWKFFKGKPIERYIFVDICLNLDLDWHEIADLDLAETPTPEVAHPASLPPPNLDIDQILQQARSQLSEPIIAQCGTLRLLDTAQPVGLDELYINVTILEQLSRQQWLDLSDLQADAATMNRVAFNRESQLGISGNDAIATYPKLVLMGKPGAGKTTFLQKIALQCLRNELPLKSIPLFIRLRNLAEEIIATSESHFNLVDSLTEKLGNFGIAAEHIKLLFKQGIVASPDEPTLLKALQQLSQHVTQPQWREVFVLTTELLRNAEPLLRLMKQQIDGAIATEVQLQAFLRQIEEKCRSLPSPYKPAAVRAFYFTLFLDRDLGLAVALDRNLARDLAPELALDLALARAFSLVLRLTAAPEIEQILALGFALNLEGYLAEKSELESALQQLKEQLPDLGKGKDYLLRWWREQGRDWAASFRSMLREHRQIGEDWQWSEAQLIPLKQYYQANQLFVDCLNSDCRCDAAARSELEEMVLLSAVQLIGLKRGA